MNRIGLLAAWIAATGLATFVAWQVVGAADDQIADSPTTPLIAVTTPDSSTSTSSTSGAAPSTTTTTVTTTTDTTTESTTGTSTSTTVDQSTTTTTVEDSTSTTTTGIPATTTAVSEGGTVTVTGVEPAVELVAVVASPGWSYEITRSDGDRIEVTFRNATGAEIQIDCRWENGRLVAEIDD